MEQAQQAQQQQLQAQQEIAAQRMQQQQLELQMKDQMNTRDNETKILVATISANASMAGADDGIQEPEYSQEAKDNLAEKIREFDARLKFDRERLAFDKDKAKTDARLKEKQINKKTTTSK